MVRGARMDGYGRISRKNAPDDWSKYIPCRMMGKKLE